MGQNESKYSESPKFELNWKDENVTFPRNLYRPVCEMMKEQNKVYIIGGSFQDDNYFIYHFDTNKLDTKKAPVGIEYCSSCKYVNPSGSTIILMYGGWVGPEEYNNKLYFFDTSNESWKHEDCSKGNKPMNRCGHSAVLNPIDNSMIVFGGFGDSNSVLNDLWRYKTNESSWEEIVIPKELRPKVRSFPASTFLKNERKMIISCGYDGKTRLSDFWEFSLDNNEWKELHFKNQQKILPRSSNQMIILENINNEEIYSKAFVFPGYLPVDLSLSDHDEKELTAIWEFDLHQNSCKNFNINNNVEDNINMINEEKKNDFVHFAYQIFQFKQNVYFCGGQYRLIPKNDDTKKFQYFNFENFPKIRSVRIPDFLYFSQMDKDKEERIEFLKDYTSKDIEGHEKIQMLEIKGVSMNNVFVMKILLL